MKWQVSQNKMVDLKNKFISNCINVSGPNPLVYNRQRLQAGQKMKRTAIRYNYMSFT